MPCLFLLFPSVAMQALNDAKKAGLEKAMKSAEDNAGAMAPGWITPCFCCCGGPVGTLKKFECVVPADKKDDFNKAFDGYQKMKEQIKTM